jgi:hypothetical protein
VRRTVPPSAEIEEQIDRLLAVGVGENPREALSELARLGARLILQRAVEDEFDAWLGRASGAQRRRRDCATASGRAGCRPRRASSLWRSPWSVRRPSLSSQGCSRAGPSCPRSRHRAAAPGSCALGDATQLQITLVRS